MKHVNTWSRCPFSALACPGFANPKSLVLFMVERNFCGQTVAQKQLNQYSLCPVTGKSQNLTGAND